MSNDHGSTDDLVRACAREYVERGARPAPKGDEPTLLALDGSAFLRQKLGRKPFESEVDLFWTEVGSLSMSGS